MPDTRLSKHFMGDLFLVILGLITFLGEKELGKGLEEVHLSFAYGTLSLQTRGGITSFSEEPLLISFFSFFFF